MWYTKSESMLIPNMIDMKKRNIRLNFAVWNDCISYLYKSNVNINLQLNCGQYSVNYTPKFDEIFQWRTRDIKTKYYWIQQKQNKELIVAVSDTIVNPRTMVILCKMQKLLIKLTFRSVKLTVISIDSIHKINSKFKAFQIIKSS